MRINPFIIFPVAIISLCLFGIGLILWALLFGVPCWTITGYEINDTVTREIMARCGV